MQGNFIYYLYDMVKISYEKKLTDLQSIVKEYVFRNGENIDL